MTEKEAIKVLKAELAAMVELYISEISMAYRDLSNLTQKAFGQAAPPFDPTTGEQVQRAQRLIKALEDDGY